MTFILVLIVAFYAILTQRTLMYSYIVNLYFNINDLFRITP